MCSAEVAAKGLSPRGRGNHQPFDLRLLRLRVYPRVGGETGSELFSLFRVEGLSPRGRGNHCAVTVRCGHFGSIPAWAGKPTRDHRRQSRLRVYPRVGGETYERRPEPNESLATGVYPRVGGETKLRMLLTWPPRWVYPRVGGETYGANIGCSVSPAIGSIPAWAGKPLCHNDPVSQENEYVKDR